MPGMVTESRPVGEVNPSFQTLTLNVATSQEGQYSTAQPPFLDLQRTTSFRTRGVVSDADEAEQWTTVTRNGFLTTDPVFDRGHEFYTTRTSARLSHPMWTGRRPREEANTFNTLLGYRGPLIVRTAIGLDPSGNLRLLYPSERRLNAGDISSFGKRAIRSTAPTAPSTSLVTAVSELARDGIPAIPLERSMGRAPSIATGGRSGDVPIYDRASDELLNVTFGWAPLISDVFKTIRSLQTATKQMRQLVRDSGRQVRRTYRFTPEITTSHSIESGPSDGGSILLNVDSSLMKTRPGLVTGFRNDVQVTRTSRRDVWFKGAFTYHIADDKSLWGRIERYEQEANRLLGTRFTAETAWNLAPWSWLVDWFADVGSFMSNAQRLSEDGLVLRYGYLMSHTVDEVHHTAGNSVFRVGDIGPITTILRRESKERVKATPFGFGLNPVDFTARQWAILYALGFTKGDRRLM